MELNRVIDHTLLKADLTQEEVLLVIEEAKRYHFYAVCVNPIWVYLAAQKLKRAPTIVCTVIGFPLGANTSETKAFEAKNAIENGADEIDMVMNIGALRSGMKEVVQTDIQAVVNAVKDQALVKVIIETSLLTRDELITACQLVQAAGADFVETSTGFTTGAAKIENVHLIHENVTSAIGVKAVGGILTKDDALRMTEAGATRLGTDASVIIITGK
ncbi:deoxyribose-phosphate aldolase [Tetragenococcus osmophilus]|uniref:Deoxyribose-phosphate aldolase n=1 Tax=Tetragenococcus osmophilus TaxID=526944 RepID=A0AA38CYG5_9ENTE|nr:deoxyribose-phosphate aldolase [Tetragenococcus osmophilus]AYW47853.1 deoxyribose-phosphate aldolase [Tetragenococcus osmophilus]GMA53553.1 deoxyribose-phosphate aldolase [Alicyclobacillus contaminans]GMA72504.1 deoxyribose-phosphate aldolase [Tetragenococcus osmophilus]